MAEKKTLVLATPVEFIRHMANVILQNAKGERETTVDIPPIITRAKQLEKRRGLFLDISDKEDTSG